MLVAGCFLLLVVFTLTPDISIIISLSERKQIRLFPSSDDVDGVNSSFHSLSFSECRSTTSLSFVLKHF